MSITSAITLGLAIAGFIGGIVAKVADLSIKFGKLAETVECNEERDTEERHKAREKFSELFNRTSTNESTINALQISVKNLSDTCNRIENKLDRIIEKEVTALCKS